MSRLQCPFCGVRELEEFLFYKTVAAPGADAVSALYARVGHAEESIEHWQHVRGCRTWLLVRRDPSTGAVQEVCSLSGKESA